MPDTDLRIARLEAALLVLAKAHIAQRDCWDDLMGGMSGLHERDALCAFVEGIVEADEAEAYEEARRND